MLCSMFASAAFAASGARVKKLTVSKRSVKVQSGKTVSISAKVTAIKKTVPRALKVKVKSSNPKIAEVRIVRVPAGRQSRVGTSVIRITGKKQGTCKISVTTAARNRNGRRIAQQIKVTVKTPEIRKPNVKKPESKISDMILTAGKPGSSLKGI